MNRLFFSTLNLEYLFINKVCSKTQKLLYITLQRNNYELINCELSPY